MAGHSHWANIAHKKGRIDKKRGALFGKLSRAIIVAARNGGGDPDMNLRLRYAIDKARKNSMPKDNIERAIKRGTGEGSDEVYEEVVYEGYGPGGVAVIVQTLTENRNRTAGDVRNIFANHGGNLGQSGAVLFMFDRKGVIQVSQDVVTEDRLFEVAADAGAEDVRDNGDTFEVLTPPDDFDAVNAAVEEAGLETASAEVSLVPQNTVAVEVSDAKRLFRMLDAFDENEDVQTVTANFDVSEEVMAEVLGENA